MLFWVNYLCMYNTVDSSVINSDIPAYFLIFVPCIVLLQLLPYLCRHRRFMAASFSKAIITVSWLQIRLPVTGGVSCPDATGLRKFHPCRHSAVSAETTTVGDERCSPAGTTSSRYEPITPLLRQLHWLKAAERIDYKLALLVYKLSLIHI